MVCSHLLRCRLLRFLLLLCWASSLEAQDYYRAEEPSRCDSSVYTDRLGIRLLGQGFFRNNEYATELADDYTLPGYRLRLDVGYSPDLACLSSFAWEWRTSTIGGHLAILRHWLIKIYLTGEGMGIAIRSSVSFLSSKRPSYLHHG